MISPNDGVGELSGNSHNRGNPEFVKYESIVSPTTVYHLEPFLRGRDVQVFEKIDGGNCQVRKSNWQLYPASRANFLQGPIIKTRDWFGKFTRWTYSNSSLYNLPSTVIVFGEWSGNHTIDYSPDNNDKFFVIDVLDLETRRFLPYDQGKELLKSSGVEDVEFLPVLGKGRVNSSLIERLVMKEPSDYYSGPKEGVVVKDYSSDHQEFVKSYHPNFAEKRVLRGGVIDYLTPGRFRKAVFRLLDQGSSGVAPGEIIAEVIKDVHREEGQTVSLRRVTNRFERLTRTGKLAEITRLFTSR